MTYGAETGGRILALAACTCLLTTPTYADVAEQGRRVLAANEDAVITVKLVIKQAMSFGGRNAPARESKSEITGTVINPSGLTVISLAATDPASTVRRLMGGRQRRLNDMEMNIESELTDIQLLLPSGREVAARVVLRDTDLDLAFVIPTEESTEPFAAVDIGRSTEPELLDQVVVLDRMGRVAGRVASATISRISAEVNVPRAFYILEGTGSSTGLGAPVFSLDGALIGLIFLRTIERSGGIGFESMISGPSHFGLLPVVVPLEDIQESAEQIPEWEAEVEPDAEPSAEAAATTNQ